MKEEKKKLRKTCGFCSEPCPNSWCPAIEEEECHEENNRPKGDS